MSEEDDEEGDTEGGEGYEDISSKTENKEDSAELLPQKDVKKSSGAGKVSCSCLTWSFIWMMILVLFAWPLSVAMAALYGFVSPMISLIGLDDISESMLQAVHVGREVAKNARTGRSMV